MKQSQYLNELEKQKTLAVDRFGNLTSLEKDVINSSFEWLIENIETKAGKFVVTEDLTKAMNDFVNAVVNIIHNNGSYQNMLSSYLSDLSTIGSNIGKFQSSYNKVDFKDAGIKDIQTVLITETINQFTENGLNSGFVQPLRDLMMRNVVAGISLRDAKNVLIDYISSGKDTTGKLSKYLVQTAQQGVDSYSGAINTKLQQTFVYTGLTISGSIIATSSTQCRQAIELSKKTNGYLTNKQWNDIMQEAKQNKRAPLIEGTTLQNLPINKLHWGCRHEFTPTIKN